MRSVTLFLLAILFLGAIANTVQRRHYSRSQKGPGGPPPHSSGNKGGHKGNNAPGHEGNNQPHEGGNHKPHEGGNNQLDEDENDNLGGNHNSGNGNGNGNHAAGPLEGQPSLDEIIDVVCNNITQSCESEGVVSNHDGKVTDLCDNGFCKEYLPKNLCFFECIPECEKAANKEECANKCMKCGSGAPPPIPKESIPGLCDEIAKGCKTENKTSHNDGTLYDLCDTKHCNKFLPKHQCFFPCVAKCKTSSTHNEAEDEACANRCMLCQDAANKHHGGDGDEGENVVGAGEDEGEGEIEGEGEGEVEGEGDHEAVEANHDGAEVVEAGEEAEAAGRIVHLMKRNRKAQPVMNIITDARGRAAYRGYSRSVQRRRRAPARRHYTAVRRGQYYQTRSDNFW